MKRKRNTVGGDSSSEPFLWCLICNCPKKPQQDFTVRNLPFCRLPVYSFLGRHSPRAPLTTEKKRISSDVFHISTSVQWSFFLLSAVVWPWSRYSSEHREKWKHVYIFFLLHARTQHSSHGQRWNRALKLNCSLKTKGCCDYGSVIIIFFSQRRLFYGLADEDSECWIFPQLCFWTMEEMVGKHRSGAKQKLRCSQRSALRSAEFSLACGTLCVFRPSSRPASQLQQRFWSWWSREQRGIDDLG